MTTSAEQLAAQHLYGPNQGFLCPAIDWLLRRGLTDGLNDVEEVGMDAEEVGYSEEEIAAAFLIVNGDAPAAPLHKPRRTPHPKHPA